MAGVYDVYDERDGGMEERSLAESDGAKGEKDEKLRDVSEEMSGSEGTEVEVVDAGEFCMV